MFLFRNIIWQRNFFLMYVRKHMKLCFMNSYIAECRLFMNGATPSICMFSHEGRTDCKQKPVLFEVKILPFSPGTLSHVVIPFTVGALLANHHGNVMIPIPASIFQESFLLF
jgi:hypothetical protein